MENSLNSHIIDINDGIINIGDTIKWYYLNWNEGSSEKWFGTEPENSYHVVEVYVEQITSDVVLYLGAMCVRHNNSFLSLKEIMETMPVFLDEFANIHQGYELDLFLNESVFEDRKATLEETRELFNKFEIINK